MPLVSLPLTCACVLLSPAAARAQAAPAVETTTSDSEPIPDRTRRGEPSRLYVGMWTTHLKQDVITLDNNWAIGVSYRGFFGATFLNSYGRRAFAGGLQRTLLSTGDRPIGASLGFRLGVVTGYDGRLIDVARQTPVLPLVQPFVTVDIRDVGFEVSYTFVVVSIAVSYKF